MIDPTLARRYGEAFARAHEAHYSAWAVIDAFTEKHPLHIPDPAHPDQSRARYVIRNPEPHTLNRSGDTLACTECGESVHAPSPPRRPLTPQEASLSRFD